VVTNGDGHSDAGAAALARQLALDPGTSSSAYKTLSGVTAGALRSGHISNAGGKNVLLYALDDGQAQTWFGKMASGRAIRIQQALDLLDARIREAVKSTFLSNEYIPMSDGGIALMKSAVRGVLSTFAANGIIIPAGEEGGFTVTAPKASQLSDADKVAGRLSNLRFSCTMPNDMIRVVVSGVVSF
jgi:hypothetical protein